MPGILKGLGIAGMVIATIAFVDDMPLWLSQPYG